MSKKITSLLTLLLLLFVSTGAKAQFPELELKSVTVGTALAEFEPDTWYFLHQGREGSNGTGAYAPLSVGEMPSFGGLLADPGVGQEIKKLSLDGVPTESPAVSVAAYLVRFRPVDGKEGAYRLQFATGNYMTGPAGSGNSQTFSTTENVYDAGEFNFYPITSEVPGAFGFNVYDMGARVDNNGTGYTVVTWDSGQHSQVLDENSKILSNSIWGIVEIEWGDVDERDVLLNELTSVYLEYSDYYLHFIPGTDPGQYNPELLAAFKAALDAGNVDDNPDIASELTSDEIRALVQAIKDTYEAVLASKVPMNLPKGYYFIQTAMPYQTTVTDEETLEAKSVEVDKFMYSATNGSNILGMWGTPQYECLKLWYVTPLEEDRFDIVNMGTNSRFNNVATSTNVTMSTTSTSEMVVTPVITKEGVTMVNINVYGQNGDKALYLHQGAHGASGGIGTGQGSNLVGWYSTYNFDDDFPQASEWKFVPVSDEEAQQIISDYEPIVNREALLARYDSLMTTAKANIAIAEDIKRTELITENSQFSSPYTEPNEGSLNNLLDDNNTTFWHSKWSGGSTDGGIHYLQIELAEPVDEEVFLYFARRNGAANDHVTEMEVFGTDDPEAEKSGCESLLLFSTPFTSQTQTVTSDPFDTKGYRYIRLYANATTSNRGYWHVSEVRLYQEKENENAQSRYMGDLYTNLLAVIESQADIERDDITIDEYNELKEALDAFMTKFVDPTELRQALADSEGLVETIVIGDQPGFWSADNGAGAFKTLCEEATAYDQKGDYTPEQSADYVQRITEGVSDIYASANQVQTGKWYKIRFATEEAFDNYGWDRVAGEGSPWKAPDLFGKYLSLGYYYKEDGMQYVEYASADTVGLQHHLHFLEEDDIDDEEAAEFRFINVGDTTFTLQHRATGLFLKAAGTSGVVTLSAHPSFFNARAIGYGLNVFAAKSITGEPQSYLHAQVDQNTLVTWNVDYIGSRSAFFIEEAEDVSADYDGTEFNVPIAVGGVKAFCFPVEVSLREGDDATLWEVAALEDNKVTLTPIRDKAEGGHPFLLVNGNIEDYDAEEEALEKTFAVLKHGYDVTATEPQTSSLLKGSFSSKTVGTGIILPEGNTLTVSKRSNTAIDENSAYITGEAPLTDLEAVLEIIWDEDGTNGIQTALQNVSKSGAIYTIDGRLVSKHGNLNDLSRFGKGVYILNGVKVLIK